MRCRTTSKNRLPTRVHVSAMHELALTHIRLGHSHATLIHRSINGSAGGKRRLGRRRHRIRRGPIPTDACKVVVIVVVRNIVDIGDIRIRNVDIMQITGTHPASAAVPATVPPSTVVRIVRCAPA